MRVQKLTAAKLLLIVFFLFAVFFPLSRMFACMAGTDVLSVVRSGRFLSAVRNSLSASLAATCISVVLGIVLAFCTERINGKGRHVWTFLFLIPMLIPSISTGMGLVILLGRNGILTNLLRLPHPIYGFGGIVAGSVLYSFPVAYIMTADIIRYEDSRPYEAADILGIPKAKQFTALFVPYIRKPLISVVFTVFTLIVTDYGVPLMIGGRCITLPVMMYEDVIGLLDFGKGSVIGAVLLVPAVIAFILDTINRDKASSSFGIRPFKRIDNPIAETVAFALCALTGAVIVLPAASFLLISIVQKYPIAMQPTFDNFKRAFSMNTGTYLANSLLISSFVSLLGSLTACILSYLTVRTRSKISKPLHLCAILTLAIPGLVLGLSYVLFFKGSFLYGTFAILIMVNMIHFFSSPYLMMYNTLGKLNSNLEIIGSTMDIPRTKIIVDVILPQAKSTVAEMAMYFFVNSMMTISAVSFLATTANQPLSLMIPSFESQMLFECAGVVSLCILAVNLLIKALVIRYKKIVAQRDAA